MKNKFIFSIAFGMLLFSCGNKEKETVETSNLERMEGKEVPEKISFTLKSFHTDSEQSFEDYSALPVSRTDDKQNLGLPSDFLYRDFLENSVGYKDKLDYLVGMVVKKQKFNGTDKFTVVLDFKVDGAEVTARIPAQGILIEKKYDSKIGADIQYLIAKAEVEKNSAVQILISDVSEITINDKSINKLALYNTYHDAADIDKYYIIRAAVTTSILYKKFTKISAKSEFNATAIKVGSNYYSENSDLKQDWKIGMQLTPVKEFLKGYKPATETNP